MLELHFLPGNGPQPSNTLISLLDASLIYKIKNEPQQTEVPKFQSTAATKSIIFNKPRYKKSGS